MNRTEITGGKRMKTTFYMDSKCYGQFIIYIQINKVRVSKSNWYHHYLFLSMDIKFTLQSHYIVMHSSVDIIYRMMYYIYSLITW